jgi:membrane protein
MMMGKSVFFMADVAQKTTREFAASAPPAKVGNHSARSGEDAPREVAAPPSVPAEGEDTAVLLAEGRPQLAPVEPKVQQVAVIIQPGYFTRTLWLLQRACWAAQEDNCFAIAKGAAYSGLLCLFPVLATVAAILLQVRAESTAHVIRHLLVQILPPDKETEELIRFQFNQGTKPLALLVGAAFLALWAASGAMLSLMEGFQAAYRIPSGRSMVRQRLVAVLLVLVVALPSTAASILLVFGSQQETSMWQWLGFASSDEDVRQSLVVLGRILRYSTAALTTVFVTGLLYYFGPYYRFQPRMTSNAAKWRFLRVWPGALVATVLWFLATLGFGWYVRNIASYNVVYGTLKAGLILLVWLYLLALIAMIGCEFNAERERAESLLSLW